MSDEESMEADAKIERAEGESEARVMRHNRRESSYNPERAEPPRLKCIDCFNFNDECSCADEPCEACSETPGRVYNNADITSGQWVVCEECDGTGTKLCASLRDPL